MPTYGTDLDLMLSAKVIFLLELNQKGSIYFDPCVLVLLVPS